MKNKLTFVLAALLLGAIFISSICGEVLHERHINPDFTADTVGGVIPETAVDATEACEPLGAETTNSEVSALESVDIKDLHPLYQKYGYPNPSVRAFLHAAEVEKEPMVEYNFIDRIFESVKCIMTGEYTYEVGDISETTQINVYLTFNHGTVGTMFVNDKYISLSIKGWIPCQDQDDSTAIRLEKVGENADSVILVQPQQDWFGITAIPTYAEPVERQDTFRIYSELPTVSSLLDVVCPMNNAKCVYSGTIKLNFLDPMYVDIYAYYTDDGMIGTWIACSYGSNINQFVIINVPDWVFMDMDYYCYIRLGQTFYPDGKCLYLAPCPRSYEIVPCPGF